MNQMSGSLPRARGAVFWLALVASVAVHGESLPASGTAASAPRAPAPAPRAAASSLQAAASSPAPRAKIRATIVVTGGGKPLEQAEVTFDHDKSRPKKLFTGKNGEVVVVYDARRKVNIRVIKDGWATRLADEVDLADGGRVEIKLEGLARP